MLKLQQRHFRSARIFLVALAWSAVCLCLPHNVEADGYAAVDEGRYLGRPDIVYPIIITDNAAVNGVINQQIRSEVAGFIDLDADAEM